MATQVTPGAFWEDRDKRSTPFVTFMLIALRHQIHHGMSDRKMGDELNIDVKTYLGWRSSVPFPGVLENLVNELDVRYSSTKWPATMKKLRTDLVAQQHPIDRNVIPKNRSHTGLPTTAAFNRALDHCLKSVLEPWARKKYPDEGSALKVAREVAKGLKWAYSFDPVRNIASRRDKLIQQASALASVSAELTLLKFMSRPYFALASTVVVSQRETDLKSQLATRLKSATLAAKNYLNVIELVAIEQDQWSEKSTACYPPESMPPVNPKDKATQLKNMNRLLGSFAKISVTGNR